MERWWNWFRRPRSRPAAGASSPGPAPVPVPEAVSPPADPEQLARPAAERLAEDEALRGDLTDDGYEPVLSWVSDLLVRAARRVAVEPEPAARMEQIGTAARELARALVRAAERDDRGPLAVALAPPLLTSAEAERACRALASAGPAGTEPDARAPALVRALAGAVQEEQA